MGQLRPGRIDLGRPDKPPELGPKGIGTEQGLDVGGHEGSLGQSRRKRWG